MPSSGPDPSGPAPARWLDAAIAACLAPRCAVCRRWLATPSRGAVCQACWSEVRLIRPPRCQACGAPLPATTRGGPADCALCRHAPLRGVDRAAALGLHEGTLRHVVHALKFGRRHGLASRLAGLAADEHADLIAAAEAAVPVPLHPRRRRTRGFNQSQEIARHLGVPVWNVLRRRRATPPQTGLDARARSANLREAFALARRVRVAHVLRRWARGAAGARRPLEGRRLLLVDDVWTTGATLSACAAVLREAGAAEVSALVIARAVPSRLR